MTESIMIRTIQNYGIFYCCSCRITCFYHEKFTEHILALKVILYRFTFWTY